MNRWINELLYALIPGTCILCRDRTRRNMDLCPACEEKLPWLGTRCIRCAVPLSPPDSICGPCLEAPPLWHHCFAAFRYEPPMDRLIGEFKNRQQLVTGKVLATLLACAWDFQQAEPSPDLLVPVPLHKSRLRRRGYNQAAEIADVLADHCRLPIDNHLCRKIHETTDQKTLDARTRMQNLKNAYQLDHDIPGVHVGLVDDVMTTGATAHELTRLLLRAGAASVQVIVLARTPRHR